ncbi:MAG: hypothetical protein P8X42_08305 [Calditrichaceae bacterium]
MVNNEWMEISNRFDNVKLHKFQVMPNHFHAIMEITKNNKNTVGATLVVATNKHCDDEKYGA